MIGSGTPVALARFRVIGAITSRFFSGREPRWVGSKSGDDGDASTVVVVFVVVAVLMIVLLRPSLRRGCEPR